MKTQHLHGIEDDQPILAVWNGEGKGSGKDKSSTEKIGSHKKYLVLAFTELLNMDQSGLQ